MTDIKKFDIATCVTDSLIEVFDMMLSMKLELSDDELHSGISENQILGSVSLAGKVMGSITFQVSRNFSFEMTAAMLGIEMDEVEGEEDVKDVISEMCNIVGGNLKSKFCDAGLTCDLSPPAFTTGNDFKIESLNTDRYERYIFAYNSNPVTIEVGVKVDDTLDTDEGERDITPGGISDLEDFDIKTCITKAMINMFDTMLSTDLESAEVNPELVMDGKHVVGTISFIGLLMGELNIYVSNSFSRQMTAAMLGMDVQEVEGEEEIKDVISEVCNIVGGNLKSKLCDAGLICELSTPSYIVGTDFTIELQQMTRYESFGFRHKDNAVLVEVGAKITDVSREEKTETKEVDDDIPYESVISQDDIDALITDENDRVETDDNGADKPPDSGISQDDIDALIASESTAENKIESAEDTVQERIKDITDADLPDLTEKNLNLILDLPLEITVELGQTEMPIKNLLKLSPGSVIELSNLEEEPLNILVNKKLVARGKVVVVNEKYGVRVTEIIRLKKRI